MKPLAGVTVLDLSSNIAGPVATLTLGRLGARVIKVERPEGDPSRAWAPMVDDRSLVFDGLNRGKESVVLDLKSEAGRSDLDGLIAASHVLVHNFTPRVASRLRLLEADVRSQNPEIVYCTVGAFGSGAVGAALPGYDGVAQAFAGIMEMTGHEGSPPTRCAPAVIDMGTGQWAAIGVLAALFGQSRGADVGSVETTLVDTAIGLVPYQATEALLTGNRPPKYGTGSPLGAPHEVFPAKDRPLFIGAPSEHLWVALVDALEAPELAEDPRFVTSADRLDNIDDLRAELTRVLASRTATEWIDRLRQARVPTAEVLGLEETVVNELATERQWFERVEGTTPVVRIPIMLDDRVIETARRSPLLGEQTEAVLREFSTVAMTDDMKHRTDGRNSR